MTLEVNTDKQELKVAAVKGRMGSCIFYLKTINTAFGDMHILDFRHSLLAKDFNPRIKKNTVVWASEDDVCVCVCL